MLVSVSLCPFLYKTCSSGEDQALSLVCVCLNSNVFLITPSDSSSETCVLNSCVTFPRRSDVGSETPSKKNRLEFGVVDLYIMIDIL